ncbi:MAG: 4'-phosphopantetheinyl transferase superfamily protein [Oscillospiraceae bacterium]|nr:4'-phosphopantetheinyl transferase superfamily protein [Oscillospiraceae bacterium]
MRIYVCAVRDFVDETIREPDLKKFRGLVTATRRKRISNYIKPQDKARCLVSGLLLRRFCGVIDDSQLEYGEKGKPFLKAQDPVQDPIQFNLSHSGEYVVLLLSTGGEIGIDIEKVKPYSKAVAERCFTPAELDWLNRQNTAYSFYEIWTAKESIMKATGLGFSLPPRDFEVLENPIPKIAEKNWHLERIPFENKNYIICCASDEQFTIDSLQLTTVSQLL